MAQAVLETKLSLPNKRSGKVRDLYDVTLTDGTEALRYLEAYERLTGSKLEGV
jgi:hypothetical protein